MATVSLRAPEWAVLPMVSIGDADVATEVRGGYFHLTRAWRAGDRVTLDLGMETRTEAVPGDARTVAFVHGPLVLAADLGPGDKPFDAPAPALVEEAVRPAGLKLSPFFAQYDRRTAVYFPKLSVEEWRKREANHAEAQREAAALAARTADLVRMGEAADEKAHGFACNHSDLFSYSGKSARQLPWGQGHWLEVSLAVPKGPAALHVLYWGEEVGKKFDVIVEGEKIAFETRATPKEARFVGVEYPLPAALVRGRKRVRVRFETRGSDAFFYEVRTVRA